ATGRRTAGASGRQALTSCVVGHKNDESREGNQQQKAGMASLHPFAFLPQRFERSAPATAFICSTRMVHSQRKPGANVPKYYGSLQGRGWIRQRNSREAVDYFFLFSWQRFGYVALPRARGKSAVGRRRLDRRDQGECT